MPKTSAESLPTGSRRRTASCDRPEPGLAHMKQSGSPSVEPDAPGASARGWRTSRDRFGDNTQYTACVRWSLVLPPGPPVMARRTFIPFAATWRSPSRASCCSCCSRGCPDGNGVGWCPPVVSWPDALGIALAAAASNTFNCYIERDREPDGANAQRPLPSQEAHRSASRRARAPRPSRRSSRSSRGPLARRRGRSICATVFVSGRPSRARRGTR